MAPYSREGKPWREGQTWNSTTGEPTSPGTGPPIGQLVPSSWSNSNGEPTSWMVERDTPQTATEPNSPLSQSPSMPDLGGGGGGASAPSMPSMPGGDFSAAAATAKPPEGAMQGLQAASGENPAAFRAGAAPMTINPNLGRRILPNEISALKALTY